MTTRGLPPLFGFPWERAEILQEPEEAALIPSKYMGFRQNKDIPQWELEKVPGELGLPWGINVKGGRIYPYIVAFPDRMYAAYGWSAEIKRRYPKAHVELAHASDLQYPSTKESYSEALKTGTLIPL